MRVTTPSSSRRSRSCSSSSHSNRAHSRIPENGTGPYAAKKRLTLELGEQRGIGPGPRQRRRGNRHPRPIRPVGDLHGDRAQLISDDSQVVLNSNLEPVGPNFFEYGEPGLDLAINYFVTGNWNINVSGDISGAHRFP